MMGKGILVISLDFELMWGNIESWTVDGYGKTNVSHVREVVERLLLLFEKYQVKATFATVGLLMQKDCQTVKMMLPRIAPSYNNIRLSPYENNFLNQINETNSELFFAKDISKFNISHQVKTYI